MNASKMKSLKSKSGLVVGMRFGWLAVLALWSVAWASVAQQYPVKPVRVVVPAPPGGQIDAVARAVSQYLGERLGHSFVVENRAGASTMMGSDYVARAVPDGYTLLVNASLMIITPMVMKKVPYDVVKDFTPISNLASVSLVVAAHPAVPAENLRDFIALAKANPGKYAFAIAGVGAVGHLTVERIKREAGLDVLIVPYKGTAPAVLDLIAGRLQAMVDPLPNFAEHIKAGKLKPLAVTTRERMNALPNVPTLAESGLAPFEIGSWYGLWGPARTPPEVVAVLNREIAGAMKAPRVADRLVGQGLTPVGSKSEDFAAFINAEIAKYSRIIKDADIKAEN
jgi:tripartite-type tricarboxylate transporter receptor subunit TctC